MQTMEIHGHGSEVVTGITLEWDEACGHSEVRQHGILKGTVSGSTSGMWSASVLTVEGATGTLRLKHDQYPSQRRAVMGVLDLTG